MGIKKVAVLESNGETAQSIAECLKREGFEVCGVTDDGEEGLRIIASAEADVAVVGLVLKGLDGFGVLERLKESHSAVQIIATGGFSDDEIIARVLSKGARYYLIKPVSPEVVAERVQELTAGAEKPVAAVAKRTFSIRSLRGRRRRSESKNSCLKR